MIHNRDTSAWWGRHPIHPNDTGFWRIGPLNLWVQHLAHEWRVIWRREADRFDLQPTNLVSGRAEPRELPSEGFEEMRFAFHRAYRELIFSPVLPDRAIVTQPPTPLFILPGEELTLYISTPLWVRLEMAQPLKTLCEIPSSRPPDSWFGPSLTVGELCYSSRWPAFFQLEEVPLRLHRVITAVLIRNLGADVLPVQRLNLPLPRLSLFYSAKNGFWTDLVTVERGEDTELASVQFIRQAPPEAGTTQFVAPPRIAGDETNLVFRAFSVFFRERRP